jgi:hypothetical protein
LSLADRAKLIAMLIAGNAEVGGDAPAD